MKKIAMMAATALACLGLPAFAQVSVSEAWVRGTVPAQTVTGAFMKLTSAQGGVLIDATSAAAGRVEIHEMRMEGDISRMRRVEHLVLPAGRAVEMGPGGYHLMLMELKQPLRPGDVVPIVLKVKRDDGKVDTLEVRAPVRALTESGTGHSAH
jgi:copper(I)-binding protein